MVHTFSFDDNYYIYDTTSNSLHKCDKLTLEVVKKIANDDYDLSKTDESLISEIEDEILGLKKQGLLFNEEPSVIPMKSDSIKALCLHICHDCNLRCQYCFASEGTFKGARQFMSEEVAKASVDFLIKNSGNRKILEMDFFGGEPLMNFEVVKNTVLYAKAQGEIYNKEFLFTITTNGVLLSGEIAEFLNENMENVVLSLDGRKEIHDGVRKTISGKGSFDVVIKNIKDFVAKRGDKSYYVRGTFTHKNLDFSKDVLFLADNGFEQISLEPVVLSGESPLKINEDDLPIIKEEYKILAREYINRKRNGEEFNFFHFYIDLEGGPCLKKRVNACGAGNEYFSVTPSGNIFPCHQFADNPEFLMGNIFDGDIDEKIRKIFKDANLFTKEKCKDCFAKFHCSGGCAANNINFNNDINKPFEMTCEMMKSRMECALHILSVFKEDDEAK